MKTCEHDWELKPISGNWMWVCKKCGKVISNRSFKKNSDD